MRNVICRVTVLFGVLAYLVLWLWNPVYSADEATQFLIKSTWIHLIGTAVFAALLVYLRYRVWHLPSGKSMLFVFLPALLVVVNNFPILALVRGEASVTRWDLFGLFLIDSFLIGIFEEFAFRGTLFMMILEKKRESGRQIFFTTLISSLVFGLVHFANLLEGAGIVPTLMQVGYSFLIGGMCAIVLLKTGNLMLCALLHGLFDVGGRLIDRIGEGHIWNTPTVILTAVLAVLVGLWLLWVLFTVDPRETEKLYRKETKEI